jgi:hypothetical protein
LFSAPVTVAGFFVAESSTAPSGIEEVSTVIVYGPATVIAWLHFPSSPVAIVVSRSPPLISSLIPTAGSPLGSLIVPCRHPVVASEAQVVAAVPTGPGVVSARAEDEPRVTIVTMATMTSMIIAASRHALARPSGLRGTTSVVKL